MFLTAVLLKKWHSFPSRPAVLQALFQEFLRSWCFRGGRVEVVTSVQRRRRWTLAENLGGRGGRQQEVPERPLADSPDPAQRRL